MLLLRGCIFDIMFEYQTNLYHDAYLSFFESFSPIFILILSFIKYLPNYRT